MLADFGILCDYAGPKAILPKRPFSKSPPKGVVKKPTLNGTPKSEL